MLNNITVLDLTNVLAGPFCCFQLSQMGAKVIKIERPQTGDLARQLGSDEELSAMNMGVSFLAQNAGKKSITLNLKTKTGIEILNKLVKKSDVLVENFRPGIMKKLGVDYTALKKVNPNLIFCSISGFGQHGPLCEKPAYDQIIQGISGVMSITGRQQDGPMRAGYPLADTIGGLTASMAICAALNQQPRGCNIDISMLESVLSTMGWAVSNYLIGGVNPSQNGNENMTSSPSGTFETQKGLLNISANEEAQWQKLVSCLKRSDLLKDYRFSTRKMRKRNRTALKEQIEKVLKTKPAIFWEAKLSSAGVPCGLVMSIPEIIKHEQITSQNFTTKLKTKNTIGRDIEVMRSAARTKTSKPQPITPPPKLGEDTFAVLEELGYEKKIIETFMKQGVL